MSSAELTAQIESARAYDALMVPALMEEWAPRVADAVDAKAGDKALDVACGTGVLTEELAKRSAAVTGLDLSEGMLAVAQEKLPSATFMSGSADDIDLPDASQDVVTCQFGLMFFPDKKAAVREFHRVLSADGRCAVAVWDSLERTPAYAKEAAMLQRMAGDDSAAAIEAPFCLGDPIQLQGLLGDAGFVDVNVERSVGKGRFPSVRVMVEADLRGWLPVMGVHLEEELIKAMLQEAERELAPFVVADGTVEFDSPALIATGRKP